MKKSIYIGFLFFLILSGCQMEEIFSEVNENKTDKRSTVLFNMNIPEYTIRKNPVKAASDDAAIQIWLMAFDANGLFIERVQATNLADGETGTGSFRATIPDNTGVIHFIAGYDKWNSFDDKGSIQKDEREIIPKLVTDKEVFWARNIITTFHNPVNVTFYRNQAKVVVQSYASNFQVTGYAVMNYASEGTVAPFNPDEAPDPFVIIENKPTLPVEAARNNQSVNDCTLIPKYIFEDENRFSDQLYVIVKGKLNGGRELYYKMRLIDGNKTPHTIMRNYLYNIVIKSFSGDANGSSSFEEAMTAESSNNIYTEIFKDSPTISDDNNNMLTVGRLHFLFVRNGVLDVLTHYTKNGTPADSEINVAVIDDPGGIIRGLTYDGNGRITADIAHVSIGEKKALISVGAGALSRIITVISSELYDFEPVAISPEFYTQKDEEITLGFTIPDHIPYYVFPLECVITAPTLYPVGTNKELPVRYINGSYHYVYVASGSGKVDLTFHTAFENSDAAITIENSYFKTADIGLKARHFTNASINADNLVNYGAGNTAILKFTIDEAGIPANTALTVRIATNNLVTSQPGWKPVDGGYACTYDLVPEGEQTVQFTSVKDVSYETIVISADGFSSTTIRLDNVLTEDKVIEGAIRYQKASGIYDLYANTEVISSDEAMVSSMEIVTDGKYSTKIKQGSILSERITLTYIRAFTASYKIDELLDSPDILLK